MTRATMLVCLVLASAAVAEARNILKEKRISPALSPVSNAKFEKDFTGDKRPKVDVLHFGHPYPVVQDTEDFDKDFVKDENSDNGAFAAQTNYDRLRHKLAALKKEAAEALKKKGEEKTELEAAMKHMDTDLLKDQDAIKKENGETIPEPVKPKKPDMPTKPTKPVAKKEEKKAEKKEEAKVEKKVERKEAKEAGCWSWYPFSWPKNWACEEKKAEKKPEEKKKEEPKAEEVKKEDPKAEKEEEEEEATTTTDAPKKLKKETIDTSEARKAVAKAKENLKNCKEELEEAEAALKKVKEELAKAESAQAEQKSQLKTAEGDQSDAEKHSDSLKTKSKEEIKQSAAAEAAYEKQKKKTEQLKKDLMFAAAKVKAMRQAEDKNGGVYPTPTEHKSAASSVSAFGLILAVAAFVQIA